MKNIYFILFAFLWCATALPQEGNTTGEILHLVKVEQPPMAADCNNARATCATNEIREHVIQNFYRVIPLLENPAELVAIQLKVIIDTSGKITWASAKGISSQAAIELTRILKETPEFIPATHNGEKVNVIVDLLMNLQSNAEVLTASDSVVPLEKAENAPVYRGCGNAEDLRNCSLEGISDFVNRTLNTSAIKKAGTYRVLAGFIVGDDGKVSAITVDGNSPEFNSEMIKALQKLPEFEPGTVDGKPVAVSIVIPSTYRRF